MTGGSAEKAIDQLLAAINQGKDPPQRYQPGVKLEFPNLDVFTPEALDRIKALAGGDPGRTARLSAHVLKIAQRECAVPVLPDLVDAAAAQIDLERADSGAEGIQPYHEHSAPRTDILPSPSQGNPLSKPSAPPRHDPGPQTGRDALGVSAPRRVMRRAVGVLGVLLVAAGVAAGYMTYIGQLDTHGFGDTREIVTSSLTAIGVVPPGGQQQEGRSDGTGASSPAERTAEVEPPGGSGGEAAVPDDDDRDETPNDAVAVDNPLREENRGEENRRDDEAASEERWAELEEDAENAIKQRVREVREQAEQARRSLEAIGAEMEKLHRRQHENMQVRHARELAEADAEGADAVAQAKDRHQQERVALQRDQKAKQDRLAAAHDELDRQLQDARRGIDRARKEAVADGEGKGGAARETVASSLAASGRVPPGGQQQEDRSGDTGASSPAERTAEVEPPGGSGDGAAVPEDEGRDETPNDAVAVDNPLREENREEEDWRPDEAALAERGPELGEAGEEAEENVVKQRIREVREQAEQARRSLEATRAEMEQLHLQQEEMQARHARELAEADAEGADAVAQTIDRHQQERAALQRDQKAKQDHLAATHDELDRQLQGARGDIARARKEAVADGEGGEPRAISRLHPPQQPDARAASSSAAFPEDVTAADPVATESGLQPQSDKTEDRQQQTAAAAPQRAELPGNDEEAVPLAEQPMPPIAPSPPPAGPADGAADSAAGTAGTAASPAAPDGQDVVDLVNRGNVLLDLGDLASARLFYRLAADRGSPEGAMLMGMTFDPVYFARTGIQGTQPRIQDALHWYDQAIAMGSRPAERRMEDLRSWLERSAATGDARAKTALQQLR